MVIPGKVANRGYTSTVQYVAAYDLKMPHIAVSQCHKWIKKTLGAVGSIENGD
jgi:hypothetical protein